MANAEMKGKAEVLAKLARIPVVVQAPAAEFLAKGSAELVSAMQRAAPVLQTPHVDRIAGAVRNSIRAEAGSNDLSVRILAGGPMTTVKVRKGVSDHDFGRALKLSPSAGLGGGKAANRGEFDYVRAMEFGHFSPHGVNIPPHPFFYPTYRAWKRGAKTKMYAGVRKELRALFPEK